MNRTPSSADRLAVFTAMLPDWTPRQALENLRALGIRKVEWATHYSPGKLPAFSPWHLDLTPRAGNAEMIRDLCEEYEIATVCLSGTQKLLDEDTPRLLFDAAERLACPMVRLSSGGFLEAHPAREAIHQATRRINFWVERARQRGIRVLVETHAGCVTSSPELAFRVVEGFDSREVGVILDPGNMTIEGMLSWKVAVELLGEYLAHVHVKNLAWIRGNDGKWNFVYTSLGEGLVDWMQTVKVLESAGYHGLYAFEDFRGGYCCIPRGIRTIEKLTSDVTCLSDALHAAAAKTVAEKEPA